MNMHTHGQCVYTYLYKCLDRDRAGCGNCPLIAITTRLSHSHLPTSFGMFCFMKSLH